MRKRTIGRILLAILMVWCINDVEALTTTTIVLAPGEYEYQFDTGAEIRRYYLKLPANYPNDAPYPVIFNFHGAGQTALKYIQRPHNVDFRNRADAASVILVYPEGTGLVKTWNAAHCCGHAKYHNIDDIDFVEQLANELIFTLNIDADRVHATGFSNGAMLVHRVAAELPHIFASVATVAGTVGGFQADRNQYSYPPESLGLPVQTLCDPFDPACTDWNPLEIVQPTAQIPVMIIRGMNDPVIEYDGGLNFWFQYHLGAVATPDNDWDLWTTHNGCTVSAVTMYPIGELRSCSGGEDVVMASLTNMGHYWPTPSTAANFDGVGEVINFFVNHPR